MTTEAIDLESMEVTVPPTLLLACNTSATTESGAISAAVRAAFEKIRDFEAANQIVASGNPRVTYSEWSPAGVKLTAAIPIAEVSPPNVLDTAEVAIKASPECRALRFTHRGPYADIRRTYDRIEAWLRERGGIKTAADWAHYSPMWEEYVNDPVTTPESELVTRIFLTLR